MVQVRDRKEAMWSRASARLEMPGGGAGSVPPQATDTTYRIACYGRPRARDFAAPKPPRSAGRRAVIRALAGPLSRPGMAYWMIACAVYLYIVTLGVNVRICRGQNRRPGRHTPGRHFGDVSAEALCAGFHKPFPRKRAPCSTPARERAVMPHIECRGQAGDKV